MQSKSSNQPESEPSNSIFPLKVRAKKTEPELTCYLLYSNSWNLPLITTKNGAGDDDHVDDDVDDDDGEEYCGEEKKHKTATRRRRRRRRNECLARTYNVIEQNFFVCLRCDVPHEFICMGTLSRPPFCSVIFCSCWGRTNERMVLSHSNMEST